MGYKNSRFISYVLSGLIKKEDAGITITTQSCAKELIFKARDIEYFYDKNGILAFLYFKS